MLGMLRFFYELIPFCESLDRCCRSAPQGFSGFSKWPAKMLGMLRDSFTSYSRFIAFCETLDVTLQVSTAAILGNLEMVHEDARDARQ